MEAARVASLRGHDVTLYEKEKKLGGNLSTAAITPGRDKINYITGYYGHVLERDGVKIEIGKEVDTKLIQKLNPDVLIIAIGAEPSAPDIPGASGKNVVSFHDVLSGQVDIPGHNVVVVGGRRAGCETALYLATKGKKVTIVEEMDRLAAKMEAVTRIDLLTHQLPEAGINVLLKTKVVEISDQGVTVLDSHGKTNLVNAETVVIALGVRPVVAFREIKDVIPEVFVIGDCREPRQIIHAIYEGALVGRQI
jgi:2-enoate reductase